MNTTHEINHILVPTDFSQISLNALETAIAIGKRQFATLTLLHIVEMDYGVCTPEAGIVYGKMLPDLVKSANENLKTLAIKIRSEHGLVVSHLVQAGNAANEISRWAEAKRVDLVVMGTHGASGLKEFVLGTTAYSVIKSSSVSVLSVPGNQRWTELRKILFPIRPIAEALEKYEFLKPLLKRNSTSVLIAGIVQRGDTEGAIEVNRLINILQCQMKTDDVLCGSQVHLCTEVGRQVLAISESEKPDLLVITATMDYPLKDFLLGSYTREIVNHSLVPVLSIKPRLEMKRESPSSPMINQLSAIR